jgi:proline racemase
MVAGLMSLRADVEDGQVRRVSTTTEPVFHLSNTEIELTNYGRLPIDISYCLNYFEPQFNARALGIDVTLENREELLQIGVEVRHIVNQSFKMCQTTNTFIDHAVQVQLYDPNPGVEAVDCRCVAIYGENGFDLTPSGTSTCAHMATKSAKGEMGVGDSFMMQSVTGAVIHGEILSDTKIG